MRERRVSIGWSLLTALGAGRAARYIRRAPSSV